jgi:hypothetical protein
LLLRELPTAEARVAYIKTIGPSQARGELRRVYEQIRHDMVGTHFFPLTLSSCGIMRVFSLRPALLGAFERCFLHTMWGGPLRRVAKEAIGVTVAKVNSCPY